MGLKTVLARRAVRVAHVLVVEAPGSSRVRMLAEGALARRGWRRAVSPAEADVLLICGDAGPGLRAAVDHVWEQMPGPRARVSAQYAADIEPALDMAATILSDDPAQRAEARDRSLGPPGLDDQEPMGQSPDTEGTAHQHGEHEHDSDHESMDHGDMDHGDMDMAPAGIALAEGAKDRDGLFLDALHVPLGPVLAYWPANLVLHCTLHGDLIVDADAEWLDPDHTRTDDSEGNSARWSAARYCDATARLLSVAGWDAAAVAARRSRDDLLGTTPDGQCAKDIGKLSRRVARSRSLRWALRGMTVLGLDGGRAELFTRPVLWLSAAHAALEGSPTPPAMAGVSVDGLASQVTGLDIGSARMIIAGCAPYLENPGAGHV